MLSLRRSQQSVDGIIVPGGFGDRGTEGKILTAKYARENGIPYLGICLGLQIAVIEVRGCRWYVAGMLNAFLAICLRLSMQEMCWDGRKQTAKNSMPRLTPRCPYQLCIKRSCTNVEQVVIFMPEGSKTEMGGTMRLGARKTVSVGSIH